MTSGEGRMSLSRVERLRRVIEVCKSVEERGLDPFLVNVDDVIFVIKEHLLSLNRESTEELCLDAEAVCRMASVVHAQGEWVRRRSSTLYKDPFILEERVRTLSKEQLIKAFLTAWRPIVELEQLSPHVLEEAVKYWRNLLPLGERWKEEAVKLIEVEPIGYEELVKQRLLSEEAFSKGLKDLYEELKLRTKGGKLPYWDFICANTYEETVRRAYLTSFLVTYDYAELEGRSLEDDIYLRPRDVPKEPIESQRISLPISISVERWIKWRDER